MDLSTKAREREREILLVHVLPFLFFFCETHLIFMLKDLIKNLLCFFYFMGTCYKRSSLFTCWTFTCSRLMKIYEININSKCKGTFQKCIADKFEFHLVFFQWRFIRAIQFSTLFLYNVMKTLRYSMT